ncbi:MAG: tRNA 2-thiouridine(34) synthase MnmA [Halobacteriovorax sp.]|nr:tRNA 2-thiouridine(34) synthase MnmA [Halobacteriovorax sp.]|tara:strand:- start:33345 stop:34526 length:1182 start_codon:yes stop_codon:yes gene_type:complete
MDQLIKSKIAGKDPSELTVVVGMSGGVDSSVTAALLKEWGFNVIGLFMKNWEEKDENGVCNSSKEYADVISVCEKLDLPYYSVEFVKEYRENVFSHFVEEYKAGYTPNPDILCNREIKFKVFFEKALELGADFLATGHYCQTAKLDGENRLLKGLDKNKDQSYFLYTNKDIILEKVLFPIGGLEKSEVRDIANKYNLSTAEKKDSTGICFIGERNFKNFLSNYIDFEEGEFVTLSGEVVGRHSGLSFYTLGQRKGLGLGGPGEPWYVVAKDIENNKVIVERGEFHPAMYCDELTATELSFVSGEFNLELPFKCKAKVRYRQQDQDCQIVSFDGDELKVIFDDPQRAVTPRQSIVFYTEMDGQSVCLGGALIKAPGPSYFDRGIELPKGRVVQV